MTQDELAKKMNVTRQTVSNWETGKNQPDIDTLNSLASVFGTDINEIIYGNKKNEYPKYQKAFIKDIVITLFIMMIVIGMRLLLIPCFRELIAKTFNYSLEFMVFDYVSTFALCFCIGFCFLAVLSLWFDCSVCRTKRCLTGSILCVIPIVILLCEYLFWKLISHQTPLYFYNITVFYQWIKPVVLMFLPAVSGVFAFLHHNRKKKATER